MYIKYVYISLDQISAWAVVPRPRSEGCSRESRTRAGSRQANRGVQGAKTARQERETAQKEGRASLQQRSRPSIVMCFVSKRGEYKPVVFRDGKQVDFDELAKEYA